MVAEVRFGSIWLQKSFYRNPFVRRWRPIASIAQSHRALVTRGRSVMTRGEPDNINAVPLDACGPEIL